MSELSSFAANEFYLSGKEKGFELDRRATLRQVAKITKEEPPELKQSAAFSLHPLFYVWQWFLEVHNLASNVTYAEIKHWCELTGRVLNSLELQAFQLLTKHSNG